METEAKYLKQSSSAGLWKVVDPSTGWIVMVDHVPLDNLEETEAEETIELLEAGQLTPDTPQAPPQAG